MVHNSKDAGRLLESLTAKERIRSILAARRQGEEPSKSIVTTMPQSQAAEFDRLIDLLVAVERLTPYILLLRELVRGLGIRRVQMHLVRLRSMELTVMADYVRHYVHDPITESEYADRVDTLRRAEVPVTELAEILTDHRADAYPESKVPVPWEIQLRECERELESLVADGTLPGRREGNMGEAPLLVPVGLFYDWLEVPMPVFSEALTTYEVLPDDEANWVTVMQHDLKLVREVGSRVPRPCDPEFSVDVLLTDEDWGDNNDGFASWGDSLPLELRDEAQAAWAAVRAYEVVAEEMGNEHFGSQDPLTAETRVMLGASKRELEDIRGDLVRVVGHFELPEPTAQEVGTLRRIVKRSAGWRSTGDASSRIMKVEVVWPWSGLPGIPTDTSGKPTG